MKTKKTLLSLLILGISLTASVLHAQVTGMAIDQSNDNYGYYFLDRTSGWQSFTAGTNGHLGAVELYFYSTGSEENHSGGTNWSATLRIREGEGTSGAILAEQTIAGDGVKQKRTFILETPVQQTSESIYTLCFDNATTGLTVRASGNVYTNGRSHNADYDYNFSTFILDSDWSEEMNRDTNFTASCTVISNEAQLAQLAYLANSGNSFYGQTITLVSNLNLSTHYWTPIGFSSAFQGIFDGGSNVIRGVVIDHPGSDNQGLFGIVESGSLRYLDVADVDITGNRYVGGLCGSPRDLLGCRLLSGRVSGSFAVGGVAGWARGKIDSCANGGTIVGTNSVGGVAGMSMFDMIVNSSNTGAIHGDGNHIGGIAGESYSNMIDCANSGSVTSDSGSCIGGIAGVCYNTGNVYRCSNSGNVDGPDRVGGIIGDARQCTIDQCVNIGAVTSAEVAGGIAAVWWNTIQNCTNSGTVNGESAGGIAGEFLFSSGTTGTIQNCSNSGAVNGVGDGYLSAAGIVVEALGGNGFIQTCVNMGTIHADNDCSTAAGIIVSLDGTLQNCVNSGSVTANNAAGIAGEAQGVIQNCVNSGTISGTLSESWAGGIAEYLWDGGIIRNCANSGSISGSDADSPSGGIAGVNEEGTIQNCVNIGSVSGLGLMGGLVGDNGDTISNSYWKQTGTEPFTSEATGSNDGILTNCSSFSDAPGTLSAPVTAGEITTDKLSAALNAWMIEARDAGVPLRRWTVGSASDYPTLINSFWTDAGNYSTNWFDAAATNFTIGTAEELAGLVVLVNDGIDFAGKKCALSADIELGDREWTPIGFLDGGLVAFSGDFDGNGKTVSGIYVDNPDLTLVGLFGVVSGGHILNLTLRDVDVAGTEAAGGMVGYLYFAYAINNSVFGHVTGDFAAGGVAGLVAGETNVLGYIGNCWSEARVSGTGFTGGLSGSGFTENTSISYYSYWKNTGTTPYNKPADGNNGVNLFCYAFAEAPGVLDSTGAPLLSDSLNNFVMNGIDPRLYGWTAGTASNYPSMIPLICVNGDYIPPQTLGDNFTDGMSLEQVNDTVSVYTNAHPATDAATFSDLMEQAEIMGFTFADLSTGNAILDFDPTLVLTDLDPIAQELTFTVGNGIDTTAVEAVNRLAQSIAERLSMYQMTELGGTETVTTPAVQYQTNGTATVSFTPVDSTNTLFFDLQLSHENE